MERCGIRRYPCCDHRADIAFRHARAEVIRKFTGHEHVAMRKSSGTMYRTGTAPLVSREVFGNRGEEVRVVHALPISFRDLGLTFSINSSLIERPGNWNQHTVLQDTRLPVSPLQGKNARFFLRSGWALLFRLLLLNPLVMFVCYQKS